MEALTAAPSPAGFVFNRPVGEGGGSKNSMKLVVILPTGLETAPGSSAFAHCHPHAGGKALETLWRHRSGAPELPGEAAAAGRRTHS